MDSALISNSFEEVNKNLLLVIIIGIFSTTIFGGTWSSLSLVGVLIAIIFEIVLCGRIIDSISNQEARSGKDLIKANGFNYVVVILILAIPVLIIRSISQTYVGGLSSYFIEQLVRMTVAVATLYVMPIVFLKRNSIISIPAGIAYLYSSIQMSKALMSIVVAAFLLGSIRIFLVLNLKLSIAIPTIILIGVGVTYLLCVAFAGAAHILVRNNGSSADVR